MLKTMTVQVGNTEKRIMYKRTLKFAPKYAWLQSHQLWTLSGEQLFHTGRWRGVTGNTGLMSPTTWCPPLSVPPSPRDCSMCFPLTFPPWTPKLHLHPALVRQTTTTPPPHHTTTCCYCDLFFIVCTGLISTRPLKLELEFEPGLGDTTLYLCAMNLSILIPNKFYQQ